MKLQNHPLILASFALTLLILPSTVRAQDDLAAQVESLKTYHFGENTAVLDAIAARVAAARDNPQLRQSVAGALAGVLSSSAAFDAKQFACRQLVPIAGDEQVPALAGLLSDASLAHYALLPLARIHTPRVAQALAEALPHSAGRTELEILDTLANIDAARAASAAAARLASGDAILRSEAAFVLARIGSVASEQALRTAYDESTGPAHVTLGYALLECAAQLQRRGDSKSALAIYDLLNRNPASPSIAGGALRGIVAVQGEQALPELIKALTEEGTRRQDVAAMLLREMPGHAAVERLASLAPKLHGRALLLTIGILGDRPDPAAATAIAAMCRSTDADVRLAALKAAGSLDNGPIVSLLLSVAATGAPDDRAAARDSLVRLSGGPVDRSLLSALDTGGPEVQVQAIEALARRGAIGVGPRLLKAAKSSPSPVRAAALRVLRDQGTAALLPDLVDLLLTSPPDTRDSALDAVVQVARRFPTARSGEPLLLEKLALAGRPEDRAALVTAIGQIGGAGSLDALRKASADPSAVVRTAALSALAEWPTDEPMPDLLRKARSTQDPGQRAIALRGYLRMVSNNEQRTPAQAMALFNDAAPLATRPEEKRLILAGLTKIPSLDALDSAVALRGDKDVREEAELAIVEIAKSTLGTWPARTRAAVTPVATAGTNAEARKRAEALLSVASKFGDYVMAWEVSPSYQKEGADYKQLFDTAFPPEGSDASAVAWRPMPVGTSAAQPWLLDLLELSPGEQKVAYLRTAVHSDAARDLVLEMGSDDGLKVWWNGQQVLAHNVARAVAPGQEKVTVHARPGWNMLLLKVTQNNQGWAACARITNPDGSAATGLTYSIPTALPASP